MSERAHVFFVDNLRWMMILLLIPYHAAMAWNGWGEPNYIIFEGDKLISSIVVFLSPYMMPLMFVIAGFSASFSLKKRSYKEFIIERTKRLLIPAAFGTLVFMPVMTYIADRFNCSYEGTFLEHYEIFFTKFTDLTGADGGFSVGQFWFLIYLFAISIICVGIIAISGRGKKKNVPFGVFLLLGLPLPALSSLLSVGGKSIIEYAYLFLIGYFLLSDEEIVLRIEKYSNLFLIMGLAAAVINVYLFIWSGKEYPVLNPAMRALAEWLMILALLGETGKAMNSPGKITGFLSSRSFLFFSFHYIWVVAFQYLLYQLFGNKTAVLFFGSVILSYAATFICCEIAARIPFLYRIMGGK